MIANLWHVLFTGALMLFISISGLLNKKVWNETVKNLLLGAGVVGIGLILLSAIVLLAASSEIH